MVDDNNEKGGIRREESSLYRVMIKLSLESNAWRYNGGDFE